MEKQIEEFAMQTKKQGVPDINPGDTVKVYQKFKDGDKEKIQIFEGLVLGSTTLRAVRHAPCPVLTVSGPGEVR